MSVSELTTSTQNYLKAIWGLSEWSSAPVTPTLIAAKTGLRLSSVSDAVRRLASQELLRHQPYGAVELTETGRGHALAMVRRHRLLETFLVEVLGYTWDQVHDEAEALEHAVSDFMIERIDQQLGFPTRDPHGDPIPAADGAIVIPEAFPLSEAPTGEAVIVERISDADPELLQFLREHRVEVGARIVAQAGTPYSEVLNVQVEGGPTSVPLGRLATAEIYVSRA